MHLDKIEGGFEISRIDLISTAVVPDMTAEDFAARAASAKENYPPVE